MDRAGKDEVPLSRQEFQAKLEPVGAWLCISIPFSVEQVFGSKARVAVRGTINGFPFRSSVFPMGRGQHFMMVNKAMQKGAGVGEGDKVLVVLERDTEPRTLKLPADLEAALASNPEAKARFDRLPYSHKKEYVDWIEEARRPETRANRIQKSLARLTEGKKRSDGG